MDYGLDCLAALQDFCKDLVQGGDGAGRDPPLPARLAGGACVDQQAWPPGFAQPLREGCGASGAIGEDNPDPGALRRGALRTDACGFDPGRLVEDVFDAAAVDLARLRQHCG